MKQIIIHFHESIFGIEEFVDMVEPIIKKDAVERYQNNLQGAALHGVLNTLMKGDNNEQNTKLIKFLEDILKVKVTLDEHGQLVQIEWDDINNKRLTRQFNHVLYADSHEKRLFESSLMSLTNTIELVFSRILHTYYDTFSSILDERSINFKSIKSLKSIEDVRQLFINQMVEGVIRGSFTDWCNILRKQLKLKTSFFSTVEDGLKEVFQRRNIIVHNGGFVNNIYLSNVSQKFSEKYKIGDKVDITRAYIRKSAQISFLSFSLISWEVWKNTGGNQNDIEIQMTDTCYMLLERRDFNSITQLTKYILKDFVLTPATKGVLEIYQWVCSKIEELMTLEECDRFLENPNNYPLLKLAKLNISEVSRNWIDSLEHTIQHSEMDFEDLKKEPLMNFIVCTKEMNDLLEQLDLAKYFTSVLGNPKTNSSEK